LVITQWYVH
jgi:hypothetical protein